MNLAVNARDAMPAGGRLSFRARNGSDDDDGMVVIEVEDTGEGMTPEFIRNGLFKPFNSTKGESGMGIGAYEAKEYVESLGGRISVKSEPGQGTVFAMRFPRVHTDTIERVA